jgi:hypothetical protein
MSRAASCSGSLEGPGKGQDQAPPADRASGRVSSAPDLGPAWQQLEKATMRGRHWQPEMHSTEARPGGRSRGPLPSMAERRQRGTVPSLGHSEGHATPITTVSGTQCRWQSRLGVTRLRCQWLARVPSALKAQAAPVAWRRPPMGAEPAGTGEGPRIRANRGRGRETPPPPGGIGATWLLVARWDCRI